MRLPGIGAGAVLGLLAAVWGCAQTVRTETFPALFQSELRVGTVALAPLRATGVLVRRGLEERGTSPSVATAIVARHLAESMERQGFAVVPAQDVQRALGIEDPARQRLDPGPVAALVAERFGADALLVGEVMRYQDRTGQALGASRPAGVGFRVILYTAPGGEKLWSGVFTETQQDLSSNVLNAGRYPGGGTRWLTAEEIARWGADETARALPLER